LHNFLHKNAISKGFYTPPGSSDSENSEENLITGLWRSDVDDTASLMSLQNIPKRASSEIQEIRKEFRDYFSSVEGAVSWKNYQN
jgi:hypothetical protein